MGAHTLEINIRIPGLTAEREIQLSSGKTLYALGANGVGKSALLHYLYRVHRSEARWLSATRKTWFASGGSNITPTTRERQLNNLENTYALPDARWVEHNADVRQNIALFDLIQKRSFLSEQIADLVRERRCCEAREFANANEDPLTILGRLFRASNMPFEFFLDEVNLIVASKSGSDLFDISQMSDGERNALLLAAEVLTAPSDTLLLLDEPEQHLHPSIISPFINSLTSSRADCAFVISTHEVSLAMNDVNSKSLLVRGSTYSDGGVAQYWDVDELDLSNDVHEGLRKDLLGARRKVLFVEGEETGSLDKALYHVLFPDVTIIPKGSWRNVVNAVKGIRSSEALHWVNAIGIVDRDNRSSDEVQSLRCSGVYPIEVYAVESLYYDRRIQEELAELRAGISGADGESRLEESRTAALGALSGHVDHLAERRARRTLRDEIYGNLVAPEDPFPNEEISICLDPEDMLDSERRTITGLIDSERLDEIIKKYPIKYTGIPNRISSGLGFIDTREYERAALQLLMDKPELLEHVRGLLGNIPDEFRSVPQSSDSGDEAASP